MNQLIHDRLEAMRASLLAGYAGGKSASSATRGGEREAFVSRFLTQVIPSAFRISTGDITDASGRQSGQLDVVIEYPFLPSMPLPMADHRAYLAEGVAAVVEVKSNLMSQWGEVRRTSAKLRPLMRSYGAMAQFGVDPALAGPHDPIPFFAVGYTGWSKRETLEEHLAEGVVDGILVLDSGLYVGAPKFPINFAPGAWALWALITNLQHATRIVGGAQVQMIEYAR
jgi:hypothetical protein